MVEPRTDQVAETTPAEARRDWSSGVRRTVSTFAMVPSTFAVLSLVGLGLDEIGGLELPLLSVGDLVMWVLGDLVLFFAALPVIRSWRAASPGKAWRWLGWAVLAYVVGFTLLALAGVVPVP